MGSGEIDRVLFGADGAPFDRRNAQEARKNKKDTAAAMSFLLLFS